MKVETTLAVFALAAAQAAGLTFTPPPAWQVRPATSTMRVAEFVVPHTVQDTENAEVVIYFFSGTGGSVDANIDRWVGQIQQPDGTPSKDKARKESLTINGLHVSTIDVAGTYVAEVRPGATERFNKPGFRLRAAVVETPRGPYYIKMTGPAKTVESADADFNALLRSLRASAP